MACSTRESRYTFLDAISPKGEQCTDGCQSKNDGHRDLVEITKGQTGAAHEQGQQEQGQQCDPAATAGTQATVLTVFIFLYHGCVTFYDFSSCKVSAFVGLQA